MLILGVYSPLSTCSSLGITSVHHFLICKLGMLIHVPRFAASFSCCAFFSVAQICGKRHGLNFSSCSRLLLLFFNEVHFIDVWVKSTCPFVFQHC